MKKKSAPAGIIIVILLAAWLLKSHQPATTQDTVSSAPASGRVTFEQPAGQFNAGETEGNRARKKQRSQETPRDTTHNRRHGAEGVEEPHESAPYVVSGVRIVDIHTGKTMPIHSVDLKPSLERIAAGEKNPHRNDGSVFRNSGHKLPKKPSGYYREYVVPTEGVRGPGPQRLVIGKEGEIYYTFDHYETFVHIQGDR